MSATETGFYYLQSRYYDPAIGRFINADVYTSTGQGLLGCNMFAYCRNNPVSRMDNSGRDDVECVDLDGNDLTDDEHLAGGGGTGTGVPVGSNAGGGGNGYSGSPGGGQSNGGSNNGGTPIYRYGGTSAYNLVPTTRDVNAKNKAGLSFSTNWKPGSATTTIESVNSTGVVYAEIDGQSHVTIYPLGGTTAQWHAMGVDSPWTKALMEIVY